MRKAYGHIKSHSLRAIKGVAKFGKYAYNWAKRTAAKAGKWLKNAAKVVGKNLVKFAKMAWRFLKGMGKINSWCIGTGLISTCRFDLMCFLAKCVPNAYGLGIMLAKGAIGCVKQGIQSVKKLYSFIKVLASNSRSGSNFKSFLAATRTFFKCFMNKAMSHYEGFYDNIQLYIDLTKSNVKSKSIRLGVALHKDGHAGIYGGQCKGLSTSSGKSGNVILTMASGMPGTGYSAGVGIEKAVSVSFAYGFSFG